MRIAVVTGASSGLGRETARALLAEGWRVIGTGRDPQRSADAEAELRALGGDRFTMLQGDLSRMAEAARIADAITALTDRIDVLVNNAGGMTKGRVVTSEGLEAGFAANHLSAFVLTGRLLPLLERAAQDAPAGAVRIVATSSNAAEMSGGFDWDNFQLLDGDYDSGRAYCQAKLANLLFTRGLAARLAGSGIVAHAVHPGPVDSNFFNHAEDHLQVYAQTLDMLTVEQGADTLIWTVTADEPGRSTGGYFFERRPRAMPAFAEDADYVDRFWAESARAVAASS